jgi:hypothetical protein
MAFAKYPDLRIQETGREVIEMPDKSCFIRCVVTIWRDANDPIPAIAARVSYTPAAQRFKNTASQKLDTRQQLAVVWLIWVFGQQIACVT